MIYRKICSAGVILLLFLVGRPFFPGPEGSRQTDPRRGREIYEEWCSQCHGKQGKGDGAAAARMYPKPRDFTHGAFKFRSTPSGELPTDQDLFRTITLGVPGTAMPGFDNLSRKDRWDLTAHIKTFSERFREETAPKAMAIGRSPKMTKARIERGRDVYVRKGQWIPGTFAADRKSPTSIEPCPQGSMGHPCLPIWMA
ncbi:MAG: cytochrome c [Armatimonadetes bacterium]|nr:cytochrome c [Armatimonadota bacterium]